MTDDGGEGRGGTARRVVAFVLVAALFGGVAFAWRKGLLPWGRTMHIAMKAHHPLSSMREVQRRVGWPNSEMDPRIDEYDPTQESLELHVPRAAAGGRFGLLVWISAGFKGVPPAPLVDVLSPRGIACAGANLSGNDRASAARVNLALDVVAAVSERISIDPERVYVGGLSGGGRSASKAALLYPEVFRGGLFIVGVDYVRAVPRSRGGGAWPARMPAPLASALAMSKASRHRFALITGEQDFNRDEIVDLHAAFERDGFIASLLSPAGAGHGMAAPDTLERAVAFLDGR